MFLSLFFWFVITFSKDYTSTISFPVTYSNIPKNKIIVNHLPETIDVDINASGFTIIYYKLKRVVQSVKIDMRELRPLKDNDSYFMAVNNRLEKINKQFGNKLHVTKIDPDTLFVHYSKRLTKTVPVKLNAQITYAKGYELKDSIRLSPSKVHLSGPEEQINKIKYAETELLTFDDVDSDEKKEVKLTLANDTSLIELSSSVVELHLAVIKFTEATLEIPVQPDNLPKGYSLKIFPNKISVKFNIPFDQMDKIDASSFRARVNYSKKTNSKKLKVELVKKPSNVKVIKINPEKVEFIVRK